MSTTAATQPRRVLSSLDVNTSTPNSRGVASKTTEAGKIVIGSPIKGFKETVATDRLLGKHRERDFVDEDVVQSSAKRRRTSIEGGDWLQGDERGVVSKDELQRGGASTPRAQSEASTPSVSPTSSFGNDTTGMNDTQNTIITVPDQDAFAGSFLVTRPVSTPLTQEQVREKARAMRLRLSLASYKVRTNQINVPMSRLEIRSSQKLPSLQRSLSSTSTSLNRRTALPSKPASPKAARSTDIPSSPPTTKTVPNSPVKSTRPEFLTPNLPRHSSIGGGLVSAYGLSAGISPSKDLTSSVVKGRAANGLLSLMRQGN